MESERFVRMLYNGRVVKPNFCQRDECPLRTYKSHIMQFLVPENLEVRVVLTLLPSYLLSCRSCLEKFLRKCGDNTDGIASEASPDSRGFVLKLLVLRDFSLYFLLRSTGRDEISCAILACPSIDIDHWCLVHHAPGRSFMYLPTEYGFISRL